MTLTRISKLLAFAALILSISSGQPAKAQPSSSSSDFEITKNFDIYFSVFKELRGLYVDSLAISDLTKNSIDGMLSKLDPYTEYVPVEDVDDFDFMLTGRYAGIGALIQQDSLYVRISEPYKDFPADLAGLVAGDLLKEIDGENLKEKTVSYVSSKLKGAANTKFQLKVGRLRGGYDTLVTVTRKNIHVSGIVYSGMLNDGIGYIRLTSFTQGCSKDFRDAFVALKKTGQLKSLIIDLRSNGGGSLDEAVKIANMFIPKGIEVVSARGREKEYNMSYITSDQPIDLTLPLAVLVNNSTASASEIVSGTFQDLDRGVIIGTRTFGKGLVQTVRQTGYGSKLKLTTAKYYIPSGRCVQAHNFSIRNEDGSVGSVPDSLMKEFKTQNGRKVYDGGGIMPDIRLGAGEYSKIAVSLLRNNLFFDYSLEYWKNKESIASPEKFTLTDNEYNDFVTFLATKSYDYQSSSERLLKQLKDAVKYEKYEDDVKTEIEALEQKLKHDKVKDLQNFKAEISQLLEEEIVNRYYYQAGRVRSMLRNDIQADRAIQVLKSPDQYTKVFTTDTTKK